MSEAEQVQTPTTPEPTPAITPTQTETPSDTGAKPTVGVATPGSLLGTEPEPGDKPADESEAAKPATEQPVVADLNALVLPEGLTLPDEVKGSLSEIAQKHGLTQPAAQELIDLHAKVAKQAAEASTAAWQDLHKQWVDEVKAMPEFAGAKLGEAQATIARAINQFGSPEVRQAFDLTGAGSNPHIFKFVYNLAKSLGEGTATPAVVPPAQVKSAAELFYPTQK